MNLLPDRRREGPPALRYALAVAVTVAAVILGLLLHPTIHPTILPPFFLAVAIAALYGGIGPGVVASLLSVAALDYWFFPPIQTPSIGAPADTVRVLVFLIVAGVVTWLAGTVRNQQWNEGQMNAALHASEERFRLATEPLAAFLYDWDLISNNVEWFGGMEEVLGFNLSDVVPDPSWYKARVHPEDLLHALKRANEAREGDASSYISEYRMLHRDGHYVHVAESARIVRDQTGRAIRLLGGVSDISARKRAEEALRQVSTRVEVALRGSDIGIWELELTDGVFENGRIIFTNVWQELGYEPPYPDHTVVSFFNLSHPDDEDRVKECFRAYLASETAQLESELRLRHQNGSYRTMLVRGVAIRTRSSGQPIRLIGSRVDITERKRSEQALYLSEERFRLVSEALAAFLYDWDLVSNYVEWFGGPEGILGLGLDQVSPAVAWWEARIHPDDLAPTWESARAAFESNASGYSIVYRFLHRDGHYVHVADRARIIRDKAGHAIRALGGVSDISARLRLEAERTELLERERSARSAAEAAARHRDDVLGVVSHDLRNPLAAISICASAVSQSLDPSFESAQHMLASIKNAADSAERLIRDLMDVASIEAGRLAVEPRAEAPAAMLEQAADMFAGIASAHGVVLETRTTPDLPAVHADSERVLQGLANLVTNSLRFTEPGGHITLLAEPDPAGVRFAVEDTGSGIASEDLPHVFDRFWQRQHGDGGGTGLGLSIVRGIVDAHGGQVMAESTPGKGSRFSFTIPTAN